MLTRAPQIFIMEGIITVVIGLSGYLLIVPFPDQQPWKAKRFLNQQEVEHLIAKVDADRGDAATDTFTWGKFLAPALDFKIWCFAMMFLCNTTIAYAVSSIQEPALSRLLILL